MALTALEIKDKTFGVKFRGYDANEVEIMIKKQKFKLLKNA